VGDGQCKGTRLGRDRYPCGHASERGTVVHSRNDEKSNVGNVHACIA
jgi:hypothetical protein